MISEKTKENIINGIYITLPNIDAIKPIDIHYESFSSPKGNYGIIYHMLSVIVEIQDSYKLNENLLYFAKYDKLNKKKNTNYDFSFNSLFRNNIIAIEKSGSSMTNNLNLFCFDNIKLDILQPLFNLKYDKEISLSIRFPTVVSTSIIHMLIILSYIFNNVVLEKTDLWLNDSFIVTCSKIKKNNLIIVKEQLKNIQFNEITRQKKIDYLFNNFEIGNIFKQIYSKFLNLVGPTVVDLWLNVISNMKKSPLDRKVEIWKEYDTLLNIS